MPAAVRAMLTTAETTLPSVLLMLPQVHLAATRTLYTGMMRLLGSPATGERSLLAAAQSFSVDSVHLQYRRTRRVRTDPRLPIGMFLPLCMALAQAETLIPSALRRQAECLASGLAGILIRLLAYVGTSPIHSELDTEARLQETGREIKTITIKMADPVTDP